ncbi:hypothetical protein BJ742DRAFT_210204 [Cladochytrium replicatum]|nr:hypothetical protein BJ742DRAFT_210204 [Cladochytrium replicatum]
MPSPITPSVGATPEPAYPSSLPFELWDRLSRFLDPKDVASLRRVSTFLASAVDPLRSFALQDELTPSVVARFENFYSRALRAGHYKVAFFFALRLQRFDDMVDLCLAEAPLGEHSQTCSRASPCSSPTIGVSPALPMSISPRSSFSGPSSPIKAPLAAPTVSRVTIAQVLTATVQFSEFSGTAVCYVILSYLANSLNVSAISHIGDRLDFGEVVEVLESLGADLDSHSGLPLRLAALHGDLTLANFLISHGAKPYHRDSRALTWAVAHGHLKLLQPLMEALDPETALDSMWPPSFRAKAFANAAGSGYLSVLEWFTKSLPAVSASTLTAALNQSALNGHADVVSHLLDSHAVLSGAFRPTHLEAIVERGHLSVIRTLVDHRVRIDPHPLLYPAALKGQLDILLYLSDTFDLDLASPRLASKTLCAALRGSHANVINHLRDNLDAKLQRMDFEHAHAAAVRGTNAFALRWLYEHAEECVRGGLESVVDEETLCEAIEEAAQLGWSEGVAIMVGVGKDLLAAWAAASEVSSPAGSWTGEAGSAGSARSVGKGNKGFRGWIRRLRSQGWMVDVV